ncbi:MAG: hypothetical protein DPW09_03805 [Anaerolineae bacterium]|nr:hypothetical protein [Anaerolineales bacterium]MCQ3972556.1 hypothetical protein [Anaerolineae bacterium]
MTKEQPDYLSYLLRLWRVNGQSSDEPGPAKVMWRASVESPLTRERWNFATLDDLVDFLWTQTNQSALSSHQESKLYPRSGKFDGIRAPP